MIHSRLFYHLLSCLSRKVQLCGSFTSQPAYNFGFCAYNFKIVPDNLFIDCPLFLVSLRMMYRND